jgi:aspartate/methionine/tyrosine aminotransferase
MASKTLQGHHPRGEVDCRFAEKESGWNISDGKWVSRTAGIEHRHRGAGQGPAQASPTYPDIQGLPELKLQASRFVKAFIDLDISPVGCIPVCGSMQGTFASFLTCAQADGKRHTVLFIDPGFPVQKMQLQVMGVKYETFDVYDYRGRSSGPSSRAI